ncbi:hypothetical protein [Saccharothrix stipae]
MALLAGCAVDAAPPQAGPDPSPAPATAATPTGPVDFPLVADGPRPVVLIGSPRKPIENAPGEKEKMLAIGANSGRYAFTGVEPPTPGPTSVPLPDGPATLPLVGVREVVAAMSAGGREGAPLELVSAEPGTAEYLTDRGPVELPVWRFRTVFGSTWAWPALPPSAFWRLGEVDYARQATTSDWVELEVPFHASPACPGEEPVVMEPVVTEGMTSVVVGLRRVGGGLGNCMRALLQPTETYTVKLKEPLGTRVLVDEEERVFDVTIRR